MNHIGKKVRFYRELNHIKQSELAEALGYKDHSSIGKIEAGVNDIPLSMLQRIADIFGVEPFELFEDSPIELTEKEMLIIKKYRELSVDAKLLVDKMLGIEKKSGKSSIKVG